MEYKHPIEKFTFKPLVLNAPSWITLDIGEEFGIYVFDDDIPGYVYCVLVLPEKVDPDDGGTYMQIFYSRFFDRPGTSNYSIPKEELDFEQFQNRVCFEIKPFENPRKRHVDSLGIYMRVEGTSYFGCAPIEQEDKLFYFDKGLYLKCANDESELEKEEFVGKKMEGLEQLDSNITCDHINCD